MIFRTKYVEVVEFAFDNFQTDYSDNYITTWLMMMVTVMRNKISLSGGSLVRGPFFGASSPSYHWTSSSSS